MKTGLSFSLGGQHVKPGGQHVWNFEGGVRRSSSLMLAVRPFWRNLENLQTLSNFGSTFWPGDVFELILGSRKHTFVMKSFCGGLAGESLLPK